LKPFVATKSLQVGLSITSKEVNTYRGPTWGLSGDVTKEHDLLTYPVGMWGPL